MAAITRKHLAIFGNALAANNNIAKFGSLKAGAAAYSLDPEQIQSISGGGNGWANGWGGAVVAVGGNPNVPPLQDVNAVEFVLSYMLAYLLERGIPEWNTDTEYNAYDICRKNGVIYESRTNANTGNDPAASTANWASQALACSVANSSQSLLVDGNGHKVTFDTENFDTDAAFNAGTATFTAPVAGIYQVSAYTQIDNDDANPATVEFSIRVVKNGAAAVQANGVSIPTPSGLRWYPAVQGLVQLAAGDTLTIELAANDGVGTNHVDVSNGNLSIVRVRAA